MVERFITDNSLSVPIDITPLALVCERYGVSNTVAAAIATSTLQGCGIVTENNMKAIIDRNKIFRERTKLRETTNSESYNDIKSIYFDGRKDTTLQNIKSNDVFVKKKIVEEHISLVSQPDNIYLGHVSPSSSNAKDTSEAIFDFCVEKKSECILAVGSDGTVVNTGWKSGVIRQLEEKFKHEVQWIICLLHLNELPLRHLFQKLDGTTSGPNSFNGVIGRMLNMKDATTMEICNFEPIEIDLSFVENISDDLSTDQCYLYKICQAISSGYCSPQLAQKNPGKICHSRWLTLANHLLRLYISLSNPSENVKILVEFIMKVYAPSWFSIKYQFQIYNASKHVYNIIERSRFLSPELFKIIEKVLQRNCFALHEENLILSMLFDKDKNVRIMAVQQIINIRETGSKSIRYFKLPRINFDALNYYDTVDWSTAKTEPPLIKNFSVDDLWDMVHLYMKSSIFNSYIRLLPCHNQAVERCVRVVTEASQRVTSHKNREGVIKNTLQSRRTMPIFASKKDYKIMKFSS